MTDKRVVVVVLGDLGRSPRMQYHAEALAEAGARVDVVAYSGSEVPPALCDHPRVRLLLSPSPPRLGANRIGFIAGAAWRAVRQSSALLIALMRIPRPDLIVVQTPPALPSLPVVALAALLRSTKWLIDWHNFGWSLVALRLSPGHPVVRFSRYFERVLGAAADGHLCVSKAMRDELGRQFGIEAQVLYDRPAAAFVAARRIPRSRAIDALAVDLGLRPDEAAAWRERRLKVLVSATSWSEDEDFDLLLEALRRVAADRTAASRRPAREDALAPRILIVVTGRGPLRAAFEDKMGRQTTVEIRVRTGWLPQAAYARLLAAADMGLCLHRSSSGVDLPMKVADMLGAGLAVCALDYGPCLSEQIRDGENGLLFSSAADLADLFNSLLNDVPEEADRLAMLGRGAQRGSTTWADGWKVEAQPVFLRLLDGNS
jgi:beta-1,4-mannosyltransferase